jgi:hypothetical protein
MHVRTGVYAGIGSMHKIRRFIEAVGIVKLADVLDANAMDDLKSLLARRPIQDIIPPGGVKDRKNERGEWLVKFCDRLNPGRKAIGMKPLSIARMATLLQGTPTGDLYAFWQACERAKSFDKYFWWAINTNKHKDHGQG